MATQYTLWKLLKEHRIEVPIIQRDYAQGRLDSKASQIRKGFVEALVQAITTPNEKLHLDFVYGKVKGLVNKQVYTKNKNSIRNLLFALQSYAENLSVNFNYNFSDLYQEEEDKDPITYFIPLDGQQRLTTLFLMHWYIAKGRKQPEKILSRFSYKTRKSSREFCEALVQHAQELDFDSRKPSACIEDAFWFFKRWIKDPTVKGMLEMLDEIHLQMEDFQDFDVYWNRLVHEDAVYFDFLNLEQYELEDELYIKMNARGKQLSDFENFKAWLQQFVEDKGWTFQQFNSLKEESDWSDKMDKEWSDLFWSVQGDYRPIDESFLHFFKNMAAFKKMESLKIDKKISPEDNAFLDLLTKQNYISAAELERYQVFNEASISYLFKILDLFADPQERAALDDLIAQYWKAPFVGEEGQKYDFSRALFIDFAQLNLFHRVFIYGLLSFLTRKDKAFSEYNLEEIQQLKEWLKTSRNLIYNARIDDTTPYVNAIQSIHRLGAEVLDIRQLLQATLADENGRYRFASAPFLQIQQQEACIKAKMLDDSWEELIETASMHFYFYGQVQFLLELSRDEEGTYQQATFRHYFELLNQLFTKAIMDDEDYLLQRLFFALNDLLDWMKGMSSNRWCFYEAKRSNSRQRDENWRYLFRNTTVLKDLLDKYHAQGKTALEIIDEAKMEIQDWRYFFLHQPALMKLCRQGLINFQSNGDYLRLLGASRLSHYHYELRSYALYLTHKECFKEYKAVKTAGEQAQIICHNQGSVYGIRFSNSLKGFEYAKMPDSSYKAIDENCPHHQKILAFSLHLQGQELKQ